MEWHNAKTDPPSTTEEVLVTDREDSYAVAWYHKESKTWGASTDLLDASNYDGGCFIEIYNEDVVLWTEIEEP